MGGAGIDRWRGRGWEQAKQHFAPRQNRPRTEPRPPSYRRASPPASNDRKSFEIPQMLNFLQLPGSKRPSLNLDTKNRQRLHTGGDRFPFNGTANPLKPFARNPQEDLRGSKKPS